jgi:hypothetical protein
LKKLIVKLKPFLLMFLIFGVFMASLEISWSHEGHQKIPGDTLAPHGGRVKGTDYLYLELVATKEEFKLYPFDHDFKSLPLKDIHLEALVMFPKKSKPLEIKLEPVGDFFQAKVNTKGVHRYTLELKIKGNGKTEKLSFVVEPE